MNDVEALNDKLKSFEDPEDIKRFVLYCFKKDKNFVEKWRHNQRTKKYDNNSKNNDAKKLIMEAYIAWGLLERIEKVEDGKTVYYKRITKKGLKALKWRYIAPQKPDWLTEKARYWITTGISILALVLSNIAIFKSCN